jgi:hypothetical protein
VVGDNTPYSARKDVVWAMGYNYGPGGRLDSSDAGIGLKFETFYYEAGITTRTAGFEYHLEVTDTAGAVHRPIYSWWPRDGLSGSTFRYQADSFTFRPFDTNHPYTTATDAVQLSFGAVGSPTTQLLFNQKTLLNWAVSRNAGANIITVKDNAGTGGLSMSVSTGDAFVMTALGGLQITGAAGAGSGSFPNTSLGVSCTTAGGGAPADGARGVYVLHVNNAYSGTFYLFDSIGRADDNVVRVKTDQAANKAGFVAQITSGSTNDAYYRSERASSTSATWTWGSKGSDNSFRLSKGVALGTTDALQIDTNRNVVFGSAALATSATDGFVHVPTTAGTPTGVPTSFTGRAPILIDTTGSKLWAYIGGAWKSVALA